MNYFFEDGVNVRRNQVTIMGGGCMSYPAVIGTPIFSEEDGTEPVELEDAKAWCRIDGDDEDEIIEILITAAREQCEAYVNLSFIERTVEAKVRSKTRLPYGKVKEMISITNEDGAPVDIDYKDLSSGVYVVKYTAGPPEQMPAKYKAAVLNQVAYLYEHRGDESSGELSPGAKAILKPIRIV